jgi:hypothetical protein
MDMVYCIENECTVSTMGVSPLIPSLPPTPAGACRTPHRRPSTPCAPPEPAARKLAPRFAQFFLQMLSICISSPLDGLRPTGACVLGVGTNASPPSLGLARIPLRMVSDDACVQVRAQKRGGARAADTRTRARCLLHATTTVHFTSVAQRAAAQPSPPAPAANCALLCPWLSSSLTLPCNRLAHQLLCLLRRTR